jgi:hypothetical protein
LGEAPDWRGYPPDRKVGEDMSADQPGGGPGDGQREAPKPGDLLIDRRTGRLGRVDRLLDDYVRLLPLRGGGRPWIAPILACLHVTDGECRAAVRRAGRVLTWRGAR